MHIYVQIQIRTNRKCLAIDGRRLRAGATKSFTLERPLVFLQDHNNVTKQHNVRSTHNGDTDLEHILRVLVIGNISLAKKSD